MRYAGMLLILALAGCQPGPVPKPATLPESPPSRFDAKATGSLRGQVRWTGDSLDFDPIETTFVKKGLPRTVPNPNALKVNPARHVADAFVFLHGVDGSRSRPWDHDAVEVAFADGALTVREGKRPVRVGRVRLGDEAAFVSREDSRHTIEGRGSATFSLPLHEVGIVTRRRIERPGILELSSGSAFYWLRGYLWISEHPYGAVTDEDGRFQFDHVPTGKCELVLWSPNGRIARRDRSPESGEVERVVFAQAVEQVVPVMIEAGKETVVDVSLGAADFGK